MPEEHGRGQDGQVASGSVADAAERAAAEADALAGEADVELLPEREPFRTVLRLIGIAERAVGAVLLVVILVLVLAQVGQRYLPGAWPWTGELARLSLVWATFLMAGYLVAVNRHIAVHLVDYVIGGRALAAIKMLVNAVILVTCLALIYGTWLLVTTDIGQVTAAAQIPLRIVNSIPLVGLVLVALRAALGIVISDVPALVHGAEATE